MTFCSRTLMTVTTALAIAALAPSVTSARSLTYRERQAIASRGVGAPVPRVVLRQSELAAAAPRTPALDTNRAKSSGEAHRGAIAALIAVALAACVALLAGVRRRTTATPR